MLSAPRPRDTVLVVDDDDSSRDLLAQVLRQAGSMSLLLQPVSGLC
jgi:CheY-like chemotaxis protein